MTTLSNITATEAQFRQFDYTLSMLGIPLHHSIHKSGFQLYHLQKLPPPFQSILSKLEKFSAASNRYVHIYRHVKADVSRDPFHLEMD
jgi:hypothetical protein